MNTNFTTIGHSNRALETVIEMLREAEVRVLVDVRSFPRSRSNPAYNIDQFPDDLAAFQISYEHAPALGGRRPKQPAIDESINSYWQVQSFHNYADYALSEEFQIALKHLIELGEDRRVAIMCSEAVWWRCHRRIITDYLLSRGNMVAHLMAPGTMKDAKRTVGVRPAHDGRLLYPPKQL